MARDRSPLGWYGGRLPESTGGFVGAVGLNTPTLPGLAVDPEGTAPPPREKAPRRSAVLEGAKVVVERMAEPEDTTTRPSGRIRMTPT